MKVYVRLSMLGSFGIGKCIAKPAVPYLIDNVGGSVGSNSVQ